MSVKTARLALGRAAILTLSRAAELMPGRDADNRAAIEAAGIAKRVSATSKRVVVWGDVIDCVLEAEGEAAATPVPTRLRRRRL